jgi:uncharacterized membrane protein YfcA
MRAAMMLYKNGKKLSVILLTTLSICIIVSGTVFSVYSFINETTFKVINTNVSGIIFGILVIYLGVRYLLSVQKLKSELYKESSAFSWNNFKKQKKIIS